MHAPTNRHRTACAHPQIGTEPHTRTHKAPARTSTPGYLSSRAPACGRAYTCCLASMLSNCVRKGWFSWRAAHAPAPNSASSGRRVHTRVVQNADAGSGHCSKREQTRSKAKLQAEAQGRARGSRLMSCQACIRAPSCCGALGGHPRMRDRQASVPCTFGRRLGSAGGVQQSSHPPWDACRTRGRAHWRASTRSARAQACSHARTWVRLQELLLRLQHKLVTQAACARTLGLGLIAGHGWRRFPGGQRGPSRGWGHRWHARHGRWHACARKWAGGHARSAFEGKAGT